MNTSQFSELDRVKLKIQALTKKTVENGATEAEAMSAMGMVGKLLRQYNLTMNELDVRTTAFKTIHLFVKGRESRHPTFDNLATSLAGLIDGKVWFHKEYVKDESGKIDWKTNGRAKKRGGYAFFGQEQDLELVKYLFDVIGKAVDTETTAFKKTDTYKVANQYGTRGRKTAFVSFQRGMGSRLSERLRQVKRDNDKVYEEALKATGETVVVDGETIRKPTGTSLIVLKGKLTEQEFKKIGIKLRSCTRSIGRSNYDAYGKGYAAGDRVNLNRPIGNNKHNGGYLT